MFEKDVKEMSLKELVNYITITFHEPLRKNLEKLEFPVDLLVSEYIADNSELMYLKELFSQFKKEILKHITKEDNVTFPTTIEYEKFYNEDLTNFINDLESIEKLVNDIQMRNEHWDFNSYLNSIVELLKWSKLYNKNISEFDNVYLEFINIQKQNEIHARIENEDLYSKWMLLQLKLKEKFNEIKK